jgi:hypothetical protein
LELLEEDREETVGNVEAALQGREPLLHGGGLRGLLSEAIALEEREPLLKGFGPRRLSVDRPLLQEIPTQIPEFNKFHHPTPLPSL